MKKQIILTASLFVVLFSASAQSFKSSDKILSLGIGLGSPFFGSGYKASLPVNPTISFEKGVSDQISAGATVSYASSKYSYNIFGSSNTIKYNAIFVGARGAYHILPNNEKFDLYAGGGLGYVIVSVGDKVDAITATGSGVGYTAFIGGRYLFSKNMGAYTELGYASLSFLNVGVSFKF